MSENAVERTLAKQIVDLAGRIAELQETAKASVEATQYVLNNFAERIGNLEKIQIRAVELLSPKPGEVVLLTFPNSATPEQMHNMRKGFSHTCGPNVRFICIREAVKVQVIAADEVPKDAEKESLERHGIKYE